MTGKHRRRISAIYWLEASRALALGPTLVTVAIGTLAAQAQTYAVLHRFRGGSDGANPLAGLIRDSAGNLYGTTPAGGAPGTVGVVFSLDVAGETVLYSFSGGADGSSPIGGLIRDSAGNLYGTTVGGGASGAGVVFKLDTAGTETVLHSFTLTDGNGSIAGLVRDPAGNLYNTSDGGGAFNGGVAFKLDTAGTETVLYSFVGADGETPTAGLIRDSAIVNIRGCLHRQLHSRPPRFRCCR